MVRSPVYLHCCNPYTLFIYLFIFIFPLQSTHLPFELFSDSSLMAQSKIYPQLAQCRDSANRRLQPANLTTISYAISSAHDNKAFHCGYTTPHNAPHQPAATVRASFKGSLSHKSHRCGMPPMRAERGKPCLPGPPACCLFAWFWVTWSFRERHFLVMWKPLL